MEGSTLRTAAAARLCSVHDTEPLFFSSFHLSTLCTLLLLPSLLRYISIPHPYSTASSLSPVFPSLYYRWLHLYAAGVLFFFFISLYPSASQSFSLTLHASRSSRLFLSQSPIISLSLSLFHLLLSSHSSSHFHSSLLPSLLHHFLSQFSSLSLSLSLKQH